ncbi:TetR/AcrR family transcriptional regulator [Humibacter sp.]|jgi:AcrR family transcriptional regulator|uniref:TetR/AcrR family transcriptional regulator n=1 Tax=Humibacter sp. TaxID=1940291 RepID=UPI002D11A113|nr:TetR/AcrR family transcriptional regulator [Humibacter sp.]HVX08832.1 TetR/AcrR family transcriptional regulator [Humibacter sp.]
MPRPARPLDAARSARLLDVASDAFAADGLEDASLNDILSRSGMGKGSFYHRFADKAALHDWVTRTLASEIAAELRVPDLSTLTAESFRPELSALLDRFERVAVARPQLMNLGRMFHNSADASADRAIAGVRSAVMTWIADALVAGRALGVIRSDLPADLLSAWTVSSLTTIDTWVLASEEEPAARAETATRAIDALWELLGA